MDEQIFLTAHDESEEFTGDMYIWYEDQLWDMVFGSPVFAKIKRNGVCVRVSLFKIIDFFRRCDRNEASYVCIRSGDDDRLIYLNGLNVKADTVYNNKEMSMVKITCASDKVLYFAREAVVKIVRVGAVVTVDVRYYESCIQTENYMVDPKYFCVEFI